MSLFPPVEIPQPRRQPVQARSRERYERMLTVALKLIAEKGVDSVAMSEIADAADVSIASLYQYFPDKPAIIATLAHRYNEAGQHCVQGAFEDVQDPAGFQAGLHRMIDEYYQSFLDDPAGIAVWQATQSEPRLQAIDHADMELHAKTIATALRRIWPRVDAARALDLGRIYTGLIGMTVRCAIQEAPKTGEAQIALCKQVILDPSLGEIETLARP